MQAFAREPGILIERLTPFAIFAVAPGVALATGEISLPGVPLRVAQDTAVVRS